MDVEKDWNKLRNSNFTVLFVCQFLGCVGELIRFQETLSRGRDQSACQHVAHLQQSELMSNSLALLAPSELELSGRKMCQFAADINPILRNQLLNIHSKLCRTGVIWSHFWNLKPATEQQTPQRKFLYNCVWIPYSSIFRCPVKEGLVKYFKLQWCKIHAGQTGAIFHPQTLTPVQVSQVLISNVVE